MPILHPLGLNTNSGVRSAFGKQSSAATCQDATSGRTDGRRSGYIDGSMDLSAPGERTSESPRRRLPNALRKQRSRCAQCGWRRRGRGAKFTCLFPNHAFHLRLFDIDLEGIIRYLRLWVNRTAAGNWLCSPHIRNGAQRLKRIRGSRGRSRVAVANRIRSGTQ